MNPYQQTVEAEWNNSDTASAWATWHDKLGVQGAAIDERLLDLARVRPGSRVLDLASGTGHPGIAIARRVGPTGRVTLTDLSGPMLEVARANVAKQRLDNVTTQIADVHDLPFADASFDAITCRLGIMYFTDLGRALREIARVLAPGGRAAFAAWGPLDQGTYTAFLFGGAMKRKPMPAPPPNFPYPGRFSDPGLLRAALAAAGYADVDEDNALLPFPWPGSPKTLWDCFYEIAIPMRPYFDSFSREEREQMFQEALSVLPPAGDHDHTELTVPVNFVSGGRR